MTKTIFERFKERKAVDGFVKVPFLKNADGHVELVLHVHKLPPKAAESANDAGIAACDRQGIREDMFSSVTFLKAYRAALAEWVLKHTFNWDHTPPEGAEKVEFSADELEELIKGFAELSSLERFTLGTNYLDEIGKEQAEGKDNGEPSPAS